MTRRGNARILTIFANPERKFQAKKDTTPNSVHNIYILYESESSKSKSEEKGEKTGEDDEFPRRAPIMGTHKEFGTFAVKVKRRNMEEQEKIFLEILEKVQVNTPLIDTFRQTLDYTKSLQELMSKNTRINEVSMVKLNVRCLAVLQNELPPKEKDPRSFILPCIIGSMTVKDDKVLIILGRPMLATTNARIKVFGKKNLLEEVPNGFEA
nr:hypothetical protein [Tanacetum cinerariifolium]